MRFGRWAAPAVLASAALALAACAGGSTTPSVPGSSLNGVSGAMHAAKSVHVTAQGVQPNARCNATAFPAGCFTFSNANGLEIFWCAGDSNDPCDATSEITDWGGLVTVAKTDKLVKPIHVTWSGPFPCDPSHCASSNPGDTYETDSMMTGRKPAKETNGKYKDEQIITGCIGASCGDLTAIGIAVGP